MKKNIMIYGIIGIVIIISISGGYYIFSINKNDSNGNTIHITPPDQNQT